MNYWIGVASKDHIQHGVEGGFCQLCHGKQQPLKRMKKGDWIIYYSPKKVFKEKTPCQKFTAIGEIIDEEVYQFEMFPGFIPFRRNVAFTPCKEVDIRPLIENLDFIKNKKIWGYAFRFGHIKISEQDFMLIKQSMLGTVKNIV